MGNHSRQALRHRRGTRASAWLLIMMGWNWNWKMKMIPGVCKCSDTNWRDTRRSYQIFACVIREMMLYVGPWKNLNVWDSRWNAMFNYATSRKAVSGQSFFPAAWGTVFTAVTADWLFEVARAALGFISVFSLFIFAPVLFHFFFIRLLAFAGRF